MHKFSRIRMDGNNKIIETYQFGNITEVKPQEGKVVLGPREWIFMIAIVVSFAPFLYAVVVFLCGLAGLHWKH